MNSPVFIDLSHVVHHGLVTYPGLPAPEISDWMSREESRRHYASGTEFHIASIRMVANTGTYIDAPFHRYADAADIADLPLESLANLPITLVSCIQMTTRAIDIQAFDGQKVRDRAVLVHTDWSRHFATKEYNKGHPFLTEQAAHYLAEAGAALVGIDSFNIDNTDDSRRPVHSVLLAAGIPVVEHLTNLQSLPSGRARFFAVPARIAGLGSFSVRAFALTGE